MTAINPLSGSSPLYGASAAAGGDARALAQGAIGELGHRVLAWVDASSRGGAAAGSAAWAQAAGAGGGFRPDARELARGGDVYGLRDVASSVARELGAGPAQEGALRRSLEDFTREAVVQLAGLAGAPGDRQVAGVRDALAAAGAADAPGGADGVIARLDAAAATLRAQNQG